MVSRAREAAESGTNMFEQGLTAQWNNARSLIDHGSTMDIVTLCTSESVDY